MSYQAHSIEKKWQQKWTEEKNYQTDEGSDKPKYYCLEQFPYPSGNLHMGHMRVYSIGDVVARYKRMNGFNVLHPMGWDSFGLPAENAAIKSNVHPAEWTAKNIEFMKNQLKSIGVSYDWDKEVTTCQPDYYKFNQWLFLHFYEKGLAYRKKSPVNWCNNCQTVLANEQVEDGQCWRCKDEVIERELEQWFFKITDYAERLLEGLEGLDGWIDKVKTMQKNWIGKNTEVVDGVEVTTYRLRDWLVSRQRYWGTPIPMVYCETCGIVPEKKENLPIVLPSDVTFNGKDNPLKTSESFIHTECPSCGGSARRETDTMDTFVDSSWYYLRYTDNHNEEMPFSFEKAAKWGQVDEYVGGIEHAILHLLYSRFFTKVLYDSKMVAHDEPFKKLLAQGMVLKDGKKMSKSVGNVVSPSEIIDRFGADTCRMFILSAALPERDLEWDDESVESCHRFLVKLYRMVEESMKVGSHEPSRVSKEEESKFAKQIHGAMKKVTEDIEKRQLNTAISTIRSIVNAIQDTALPNNHQLVLDSLEKVVKMLAPFIPHIAEELWFMMGKRESVHGQKWVRWDESMLVEREMEIGVQINGKFKGRFTVSVSESEEKIKEKAIQSSKEIIKDNTIKKVIYVPKRLVSITI